MIEKKDLMKRVLIENDLTTKERGIQKRNSKGGERKRRRIKIEYRKIAIGERIFWWNQKEDKLEEQRRERKE